MTLPSCAGNLVALANTICNGTYAGTHWCTAADATGTGTYHSTACASMVAFQFNGGVTCSAGTWSTDEETGCTGGVLSYSVQSFGPMGNLHQVDCCK